MSLYPRIGKKTVKTHHVVCACCRKNLTARNLNSYYKIIWGTGSGRQVCLCGSCIGELREKLNVYYNKYM